MQADLETFVEDELYAAVIIAQIREVLRENRLHALINNAAIQILGGADSLTRNEWRSTLDVNLMAPFLLTQAFLPELERADGAVVNISSIRTRLTKANFVAYATSKAALSGMTRAMAVDLGPRVRVNTIELAAIETRMLKEGFRGNPSDYAQLANCHPQKRMGNPEELAELVLAVAAGGMDFMHGACISLDGGIGSRLFDPD